MTDPNRESYKATEIIKKWEETFKERTNLLIQKEKTTKIVQLPQYFQTFPCLKEPYGIILVSDNITVLNIE